MWTVAQEHAERNIRKNKHRWLSHILTATAAPYIMVYEYDHCLCIYCRSEDDALHVLTFNLT